ncbi:MGDG synthase family glycosyltransferase [Effusibacillus lacus]|uniref:Galactosyldiacylglycerol synthase n=1 Tax=Effusibacillus lacus TaxID=1348429 RepID=A0A292YFK9_9BACL|nr:glycosyltransferase [Effusibacillus lacus]TCS69784.1 processive 1,2-diacylglycerol beta-glucosyltransferase [Effusibacillus lacus]GAX88867.1 hypothetical protein EFBL_0481 [Effusibacillus lacus]
MPHFVLLSESIGAGHDRAASAIEESLLTSFPDARVTRLNLLDTFRPLTAKVTRALYLETLARRPGWWGKWYEWQREKEMNGFSRLIVHRVLKKDVGSWLRRLAPDAVVCTHPLPACLIAEMKRKGLQVPLCTVITDFDMHGYWTHQGVDLYCVPAQPIANVLHKRLRYPAEVRVTGIPVSRSFLEALSGSETAEGIRPDSENRILIMGGGLGIGVTPMVESIADSCGACKITVVCGHNQTLQEELESRYGQNGNITIYGYTRQIARLMAQHHVLVTKPGGLTVSEALTMKLPMVLYTSIPGQEQRNGELMTRLGVAYSADTPDEAADLALYLAENKTVRETMIRRMETIRRPKAAEEIAEAVMEKALEHRGRHSRLRMIR